MKKAILLIVPLLLLLACKSNEEIIPDAAVANVSIKQKQYIRLDDSWVRSKIDSAMRAHNIPALSVGIIRDGELWLCEGFGVKK